MGDLSTLELQQKELIEAINILISKKEKKTFIEKYQTIIIFIISSIIALAGSYIGSRINSELLEQDISTMKKDINYNFEVLHNQDKNTLFKRIE